jgi:hypothetical protein
VKGAGTPALKFDPDTTFVPVIINKQDNPSQLIIGFERIMMPEGLYNRRGKPGMYPGVPYCWIGRGQDPRIYSRTGDPGTYSQTGYGCGKGAEITALRIEEQCRLEGLNFAADNNKAIKLFDINSFKELTQAEDEVVASNRFIYNTIRLTLLRNDVGSRYDIEKRIKLFKMILQDVYRKDFPELKSDYLAAIHRNAGNNLRIMLANNLIYCAPSNVLDNFDMFFRPLDTESIRYVQNQEDILIFTAKWIDNLITVSFAINFDNIVEMEPKE